MSATMAKVPTIVRVRCLDDLTPADLRALADAIDRIAEQYEENWVSADARENAADIRRYATTLEEDKSPASCERNQHMQFILTWWGVAVLDD